MAFRTDLAVEAIENHKTAAALPHVRQSDCTLEGFAVHEVRILSEDAAREIGKPQGRYLTLELDALIRRRRMRFRVPARHLHASELLPHPNDGPCSLPDGQPHDNPRCHQSRPPTMSLPRGIWSRRATRYFRGLAARFRTGPGVLGQTGVETGEVICGVLDRVRPAVIAVDALAAGRLSRLLRTVQPTDTALRRGWETPVQRSTRKHSGTGYRRWRRPWWTVQRSHEISTARAACLRSTGRPLSR
ncbi:MAG: GPR endopeptidase [Butyricicoccus sp.]